MLEVAPNLPSFCYATLGRSAPRYDFRGKPGPGRGHFSKKGAWRTRRADEMERILYEIATDPAANSAVRIIAADKLLDRIEGKPRQKVFTSEEHPFSLISDENLEAETEQLSARIAQLEMSKRTAVSTGARRVQPKRIARSSPFNGSRMAYKVRDARPGLTMLDATSTR